MTKDEYVTELFRLFDNYRNKIIESNGDFDMMVGIIKTLNTPHKG